MSVSTDSLSLDVMVITCRDTVAANGKESFITSSPHMYTVLCLIVAI